MPQLAAWHRKYGKRGLVIIGNHAPEFRHERRFENVRREVKELRIEYPVSIDNDFVNWKAYGNRYWPTKYVIDKKGLIRHVRIGEGGYAKTEAMIERLLADKYES
ncbi:MAG: hypothetical protein ACE5JS_05120 [Nitrospinota bacterium]